MLPKESLRPPPPSSWPRCWRQPTSSCGSRGSCREAIPLPRGGEGRVRGMTRYEEQAEEIIARRGAVPEPERLHRLFDLQWQYSMEEYPEFATYVGWPGQNHRWTDVSLEAIAPEPGDGGARTSAGHDRPGHPRRGGPAPPRPLSARGRGEPRGPALQGRVHADQPDAGRAAERRPDDRHDARGHPVGLRGRRGPAPRRAAPHRPDDHAAREGTRDPHHPSPRHAARRPPADPQPGRGGPAGEPPAPTLRALPRDGCGAGS